MTPRDESYPPPLNFSGGTELLFGYGYDASASLDSSCSQPSNTLGRALFRDDSFGRTWYQYDAFGRVVGEIRLRPGVTTCSGAPNDNPHTFYSYTPNGNLSSLTYPFGRAVQYTYGTGGNKNRVASVNVTLWDGSAWSSTNVVSSVAWEPYGGLRGYQLNHATSANASSLEYALGDNGSVAPTSGVCPAFPNAASSDKTGRVRGLWVSSGPLSLGSGSGDMYRRLYTWQADQVMQTDTCALSETVPETETFLYDRLTRLLSASRPTGNFAATGGAFSSRSYGYDMRDNRSTDTREDCNYTLTFGNSAFPDRLTRKASACGGAMLAHDYVYDADGRTSTKTWPTDSSGSPAFALAFTPGASGPLAHGGLDSVFKSVSVGGATYNYFYDGLNRRRLKSYPSGIDDEYFYDTGHQLLVDRGNASLLGGDYVEDDYVWLAGKPIALVRGAMDSSFIRKSDSTASCARNGEAAACGVFFIITDSLGKPLVTLDSSRRVTGQADYEVFGHVNRVSLDKETAHPYANNSSSTVADFTQAPGAGFSLSLRVLFHLIDTEGTASTPTDGVVLKDGSTGTALTSMLGGNHRGQTWSDWVQPSTGRVQVAFSSNATNCCPTVGGGLNCVPASCSSYPNFPYKGVVMEGYEYRRFQTGASPFFPPLRFPGQYYDAETELFENWNRYYEPSTGRYLQAEPMAQRPEYIKRMAKTGTSVPSYAYAANNPLAYFDANGLEVGIQYPDHPGDPNPGSLLPEPWSDCLAQCMGSHSITSLVPPSLSAWPKWALPPFRVPDPDNPLTTPISSIVNMCGGGASTRPFWRYLRLLAGC